SPSTTQRARMRWQISGDGRPLMTQAAQARARPPAVCLLQRRKPGAAPRAVIDGVAVADDRILGAKRDSHGRKLPIIANNSIRAESDCLLGHVRRARSLYNAQIGAMPGRELQALGHTVPPRLDVDDCLHCRPKSVE